MYRNEFYPYLCGHGGRCTSGLELLGVLEFLRATQRAGRRLHEVRPVLERSDVVAPALEPRRVAAVSVAKRVADEMATEVTILNRSEITCKFKHPPRMLRCSYDTRFEIAHCCIDEPLTLVRGKDSWLAPNIGKRSIDLKTALRHLGGTQSRLPCPFRASV